MKDRIKVYLCLLIGIGAVTSSWLSVQPASEYRYQQREIQEVDNLNSNLSFRSILNVEWLSSEGNSGVTKMLLIIVGGFAFGIVSITVILFTMWLDVKKLSTMGYSLSVVWIILGFLLHFYVWLG